MQDKPLFLYFPQWQGAGTEADCLLHSARKLRDQIPETVLFNAVNVPDKHPLESIHGILGYPDIQTQLKQAKTLIRSANPAKIYTLGGDCGVEITPVSYLNSHYQGNLAVIWCDAHADLNTPESSPSGHFHGMPLRLLLGEGDATLRDSLFSVLHPEQVFLVGARDLDAAEADYVARHRIRQFSVQALERDIEELFRAVRDAGYDHVYLHIDLDVLEPGEFPYVKCPTPGGLSLARLIDLLLGLQANFTLVGYSILEHCLTEAPDSPPVPEFYRLLQEFRTG